MKKELLLTFMLTAAVFGTTVAAPTPQYDKVLMVSCSSDVNTLDDDERDAYDWFMSHAGATYAGANEVANGSVRLDNYAVVWVAIDRQGIGHGWQNLPVDGNFINALRAYAKTGGNLLLTNHATQLATAIGRINHQVNAFSDGAGGLGADTWTIENVYGYDVNLETVDRSNHPIYDGLVTINDFKNHPTVALLGTGDAEVMNREDHNCFWIPADLEERFGGNDNINGFRKFEEVYTCQALGTWGHIADYCGAGIIDFAPAGDFTGRILTIGLAAYEWHAPGNAYLDNIKNLTVNSLGYLAETGGSVIPGGVAPGDSRVKYVLQNGLNIDYDAVEAGKIQQVAKEHSWETANEWNYVYNKVAFVGWYRTAQEFLAATDVDDDEKAACEWAMRQGATYIPTTAIIDLGFDLSMFDAFWINVDFDESDLPTYHGYFNDGKYTEAEKELLYYGGPFNTIYNPEGALEGEGGVHRNVAQETTPENYERLRRILMAHTAGMSTDQLHAVGVANAIYSDAFIKALKLRHQLGWNLLLTTHATSLINYIDRYSFDTAGDGKNDRLPRRWNFKKGAMVDREGYPVSVGGYTVPQGSLMVGYGQHEDLWSLGGGQDWPGTVDMSRIGVDYKRLNKWVTNGSDPLVSTNPEYKSGIDFSNIAEHTVASDNLYMSTFEKFFEEFTFTSSQQNANIYRAMAFDTYSGMKVNDKDGSGHEFPNAEYIAADNDPKFLKTINLFKGGRSLPMLDGENQMRYDDRHANGDIACTYDLYYSDNMEHHVAYFAIDRVRRADPNHDNNKEASKWGDLYLQSAIEPLATRPDIYDYCMGTLIRWYPTDQDWRNNVDESNNINLPDDLKNIFADHLDTYKGRAFTLSMPGYEWNPSQTFESWYDGEMADNNNGYATPFDPAKYVDGATAAPARSHETAASRTASDIFDRGNIEQLTHNVLYELVRQSHDDSGDDANAVELEPMARPMQLLQLTADGLKAANVAAVEGTAYYVTYTPDATSYVVADNGNAIDLNVIDAEAAAALIANPANVVWTSDYFVTALDELKFQTVAAYAPTLTVGDAAVKDTFDAVPVTVSTGNHIRGGIVKRLGNLNSGVFKVRLSYVKDGVRFSPNAQTMFRPVMPKPYNGSYLYQYDQPYDDLTERYDTEWLQFTVPSTAKPGETCEVYMRTEELDPRCLDCNFHFTRPNVSEDIVKRYDIYYTIDIISHDEEDSNNIDKIQSASGIFCDREKATTVTSNGDYKLTVTKVNPYSHVYPILKIEGTEYHANNGGDISLKATYGADVNIVAKNNLEWDDAEIGEITLKRLLPGATDGEVTNTTSDKVMWRYEGHTDYDKTGEITITGYEASFPLMPARFMLESVAGSDYSCYPFLTVHKKGHLTAEGGDSDPLIGCYIAHNFAYDPNSLNAYITPTVHVTPIYIFNHVIDSDGETGNDDITTNLYKVDNLPSAAAAKQAAPAKKGTMMHVAGAGANGKLHVWDTPTEENYTAVPTDNYVIVTGAPVYDISRVSTGIEDLKADSGEARWFTVSGIEIPQPTTAGIYLRRTATATEKVVIR